MTAYTTLTNATFLPGKPILGSTGSALRDNPLAMAEADSTAPVNQTAWHPYNKVTNGDTNTGLIYDFGVSGAVASVVSPDFADGYEYKFIYLNISGTSGTSNLTIDLYKETDAAYQSCTPNLASSIATADNYSGILIVNHPRLSRTTWSVDAKYWKEGTASFLGGDLIMYDATVQKLLRARFSFSSGNIDNGKIYMYRRRDIL